MFDIIMSMFRIQKLAVKNKGSTPGKEKHRRAAIQEAKDSAAYSFRTTIAVLFKSRNGKLAGERKP